jgi:hypothetical protein
MIEKAAEADSDHDRMGRGVHHDDGNAEEANIIHGRGINKRRHGLTTSTPRLRATAITVFKVPKSQPTTDISAEGYGKQDGVG